MLPHSLLFPLADARSLRSPDHRFVVIVFHRHDFADTESLRMAVGSVFLRAERISGLSWQRNLFGDCGTFLRHHDSDGIRVFPFYSAVLVLRTFRGGGRRHQLAEIHARARRRLGLAFLCLRYFYRLRNLYQFF